MMNVALIHAAIRKAHHCLHVRKTQGHNARKFQPMAGISVLPMQNAGIGLPKTSGTGRNHRGFFVPKACSMAGRGRGQECPPMLVSVDQPEPDRHPLIGLRGRRDTTRLRATIMQSTTPGTLPEVSFVSRSTLEKRVRRALATKGYRLLKSRPGTPAFREYGLYAVENGLRRIIAKHQDIDSLARELGVMATHERLRPRYERISTATHEGTDRMTYFVIGEPGTGKMPFDLLAGPFDELALAKESAAMMEGQGHV